MSLLNELGIDPEEFTWHDLALCQTMDPELFHSKYEQKVEDAKQADQICLHCPVMKECGLAGMENQYGLWGGIFWDGSGRPDAARNAHKTPEVWNEIKERML